METEVQWTLATDHRRTHAMAVGLLRPVMGLLADRLSYIWLATCLIH